MTFLYEVAISETQPFKPSAIYNDFMLAPGLMVFNLLTQNANLLSD